MASMTGRKGSGRTFGALLACTALTLALGSLSAMAGSLTPTAAPTAAGSAMYTLDSIYQRLYDGTPGAKRTGAFTEPTDLGATMHTLDDIMGLAPVMDNVNGAAAADVCNGKKFWGLRGEPGGWGKGSGGSGILGTGPCAPLFTQTFGPYTITENTTGTLGTLSVYSTGTVTWSIQAVSPTSSAFSINSSGQLSVTSGLDFEAVRNYELTVRAAQGTSQHDLRVVVDVTNADDNDPVLTGTGTATGPFSLAEDAASGTVVGRVVGRDADGDTLSYSITAGNTGNVFAINASNGQITRSASGTIDYETTKSYSLTVEASDGSVPAASATVTVTVTNVNDTAPVIAPSTLSFAVQENVAAGTRVGAVTATDADGSALVFSIESGNTGSAFAIDSATGQITVNGSLNFEGLATYSLGVKLSDGLAAHDQSTTVTVNITDVNESPVVAANTGIIASASVPKIIIATELSTSDVDSTAAQRMLIVTRVPANGSLEVYESGSTWRTLFKDRCFFTQADIESSHVRYMNNGTTGADEFRFTVSDSEGGTVAETTFSITVN